MIIIDDAKEEKKIQGIKGTKKKYKEWEKM